MRFQTTTTWARSSANGSRVTLGLSAKRRAIVFGQDCRAAFRTRLNALASPSAGVWLLFGEKGGPAALKVSEVLEGHESACSRFKPCRRRCAPAARRPTSASRRMPAALSASHGCSTVSSETSNPCRWDSRPASPPSMRAPLRVRRKYGAMLAAPRPLRIQSTNTLPVCFADRPRAVLAAAS